MRVRTAPAVLVVNDGGKLPWRHENGTSAGAISYVVIRSHHFLTYYLSEEVILGEDLYAKIASQLGWDPNCRMTTSEFGRLRGLEVIPGRPVEVTRADELANGIAMTIREALDKNVQFYRVRGLT